MSGQPTFGTVFVEACRKKGVTLVEDVMVMQGDAPNRAVGSPLIKVGGDGYQFLFADRGVAFADYTGKSGQYSWEELDFILPHDVSLGDDKLRAFSSMGDLAQQMAMKVAKFAVWAIGIYIVGYIVIACMDAIAPIIDWASSLPYVWRWMVIGMVVGAIFFALSIGSTPIIALVITVFASGGVAMGLRRVIATLLSPFINLFLKLKYRQFANGLQLVSARWVKAPWGLPTSEMLDLILLGVNLRRRGIV